MNDGTPTRGRSGQSPLGQLDCNIAPSGMTLAQAEQLKRAIAGSADASHPEEGNADDWLNVPPTAPLAAEENIDVVAADLLSQRLNFLEKTALGDDKRPSDSLTSQWMLVREQIGNFSKALIATRADLHGFNKELARCAAVSSKASSEVEGLSAALANHAGEWQISLQRLSRDLDSKVLEREQVFSTQLEVLRSELLSVIQVSDEPVASKAHLAQWLRGYIVEDTRKVLLKEFQERVENFCTRICADLQSQTSRQLDVLSETIVGETCGLRSEFEQRLRDVATSLQEDLRAKHVERFQETSALHDRLKVMERMLEEGLAEERVARFKEGHCADRAGREMRLDALESLLGSLNEQLQKILNMESKQRGEVEESIQGMRRALEHEARERAAADIRMRAAMQLEIRNSLQQRSPRRVMSSECLQATDSGHLQGREVQHVAVASVWIPDEG